MGAMAPVAGLRRLLHWLRSHWYGSDQIAVAYRGREAISEEAWLALPEDERSKWELVDEDARLYVRRLW
jgi:hypothetical protein